LRGDVEEPAARGDFEPEFFAEGFHRTELEQKITKVTKGKLAEATIFVAFVTFC
jgi:hypothetical protein